MAQPSRVKINRKTHKKRRQMRKVYRFALTALIIIIIGYALYAYMTEPPTPDRSVLATEAAEYCDSQNGTSKIVMDEQGKQYGVCVLPDGTACEQWAFYEGDCPQGQ